jgi:hypothetical protein
VNADQQRRYAAAWRRHYERQEDLRKQAERDARPPLTVRRALGMAWSYGLLGVGLLLMVAAVVVFIAAHVYAFFFEPNPDAIEAGIGAGWIAAGVIAGVGWVLLWLGDWT